MLGMVQSGLRPREPRTKVLVPCRMALDGAWADACIHNVSSRGMLLASDCRLTRGDYVDIRRGTLVVVGRVMWSNGRYFGIRTQDRISVDALVNEPRRTSAPQAADRRSQARFVAEGHIARRVERSRELASSFQFVVLLLAGVGGAALAATCLYDALASPFTAVGQAMRPAQPIEVAAPSP